ncbi:MAG: DUF3786 domain-containing protein [Thermodesulfobacteriota bacterium]
MPRIDDYKASRDLAAAALDERPFDQVAAASGFAKAGEGVLRVPFLNRVYLVSAPGYTFADEADAAKEVPLQEQVLILHYLMADPAVSPVGDWAAYREIPGATFYFSAFTKRAIDPLIKVFGENVAGLVRAAPAVGGVLVPGLGDAAFDFAIFPRVPLRMVLYAGDDEFPAGANILFDRTAGALLSPEDLAWLAGMPVYRMMAFAR